MDSSGTSDFVMFSQDLLSEVKAVKPLDMPPQSSDDPLLSTALVCRNRLYVERGVLLSKIDAKYRAVMGPSASRTSEQICLVESEVLTSFCNDYLKSFNYFKPAATPEYEAEPTRSLFRVAH